MIEETIKEITAAEAKAREIIAEADQKASAILSSVAAETEGLLTAAAAKAKTERKKIYEIAEANAEKAAQEFIKAETLAAEKVSSDAERIVNDAAVFIVKEITG